MSHLFSVDLGGSSVRVGHGSVDSGILASRSQSIASSKDLLGAGLLPSEASTPAAIFSFVARSIDQFRSKGVDGRGVGFSFPGLFDDQGRVAKAPNLSPEWQGVDIANELSSEIGLPVLVANDARVATLGEFTFGGAVDVARADATTLAYIGLGTGVGGGAVVNGHLLGGPRGSRSDLARGVARSPGIAAAGEFGHVVIDPAGKRCACGGRGCVETIAGGAAMVSAAAQLLEAGSASHLRRILEQRGGTDQGFGVEEIALAADAGDQELIALIENAAVALGVLASNLIHILGSDVIVFGGGISALKDRLIKPVWDTVRAHVHMVPLEDIAISTSILGGESGLLGGLVLASAETEEPPSVEQPPSLRRTQDGSKGIA